MTIEYLKWGLSFGVCCKCDARTKFQRLSMKRIMENISLINVNMIKCYILDIFQFGSFLYFVSVC